MLEDIERSEFHYPGPRWLVRVQRKIHGIAFILRYDNVIQMSAKFCPDNKYHLHLRYHGLEASDVESILTDYVDQIRGERENMNDVNTILTQEGGQN